MIYRFSISTAITYNTEENKLKTDLPLTAGVIHQLDVLFPSGPQGYLHVKINHGLHQLWPTNPDGNFASSNEKISFKEFYELTSAPYKLNVYTWNEDDTYPHIVLIRIGILPREAFDVRLVPWSERTKELYGE